MLCDSCNSGYHKECENVEIVPKREWYCTKCLKAHSTPNSTLRWKFVPVGGGKRGIEEGNESLLIQDPIQPDKYIVCANKRTIYYEEFRKLNNIPLCSMSNCDDTGGSPSSPCNERCYHTGKYKCKCSCHIWTIYCSKRPISYLSHSNHHVFDYDSMMINSREVNKYARVVVEFATHLYIQVHYTSNRYVLLHCNNSRSRSPSVLLAYIFLFCGISYENAVCHENSGSHILAKDCG